MTTFTTQDRQDAQRTPLTKDEIECLFNEHLNTTTHVYTTWPSFYEFARAIEAAHGIGE